MALMLDGNLDHVAYMFEGIQVLFAPITSPYCLIYACSILLSFGLISKKSMIFLATLKRNLNLKAFINI